jgi:glutamine synthetase
MSFQAHELPEKMKAIFGQDFMSRYYRIKANEWYQMWFLQ